MRKEEAGAATGHVGVIYRRPTHPSAAGLRGKFLPRLKWLLHVPRIKNEPGGFMTYRRTPGKCPIQTKGLKNLPCQTTVASGVRTARGGAGAKTQKQTKVGLTECIVDFSLGFSTSKTA